MTLRWRPVLTGAAVAAVLTIPALADNWMSGPTRNFNVRSVRVNDVVGNVSVAVREGPATVQVSGSKARVDATIVRQDDGRIEVIGHNYQAVWDWRHWFDFTDTNRGSLSVKITVPRGSEVNIDDLVG